ncbi:MAG: ribosome small subunit-dependent GTPase A [Polyangia bacterium]
MPSSLAELGWREPFVSAFRALTLPGEVIPGRVAVQQRGRYTVATERGELAAELDNQLRRAATAGAELPCVGDWVALRRQPAAGNPMPMPMPMPTPMPMPMPAPPPAVGHDALRSKQATATVAGLACVCAVLPRLTKFSRRAAGPENVEQVLAANIDTVFIAMGLDGDFNLRRLERYLTVAAASGARPVVLLTKADLCPASDLAAREAEVQAIAPSVAVVATSVLTEQGLRAVDPFLRSGQTIALLGSSGVGKSTLVNALLRQEVLRTSEVRASDSRGRHTTTQRQLFRVRGGALVIDTPGIRELQLWDAGAGLEVSFADVAVVAAKCHFRDCRHQNEPGCAVVVALRRGDLPPERVASYLKLRGEQESATGRNDPEAARRRKRAAASVTKLVRKKHRE